MNKMDLPVLLTDSERNFGFRYLLFSLVFLGPILSLLLGNLETVYLDTAYFLSNFLAVFLIFHRFLLGSLGVGVSSLGKVLPAVALALIAYFSATWALDVLYCHIMPGFFNVNDASIYASGLERPWLTALGTVILVPIAEETLYRGLVFGSIHTKNRTAAYMISSLLFCYIHIVAYIGIFDLPVLLLCFLQYLPAGLALAWCYEFSGSILASVLVHTAVNAIAMLTMR